MRLAIDKKFRNVEKKENMISRKYISVAVGIVISSYIAQAQVPNWTVNTSEYQYSMTIVAFLSVDHKLLVGEQDKVAAFVDGQIRGVASPIYVSSASRHLAYLTVFANKENEEIEFKIYDSSGDKVVTAAKTLRFVIDGQKGNTFQAFSLANPALNTEAVLKNFYFQDIESVSTTITEGLVDIMLEYDQDLRDLSPEFMLSEGAKLYLDRTLQESGKRTYDFLTPISYSVLSEDESVHTLYQVMVRNRQTSDGGFTCTNVITANNDGANDTWIVTDVFKYKNHDFKIIDANGRILYESIGYANDWNGYYKGTRVERGKYYFVIKDLTTYEIIKGHILVLY